MKKAPQQLSPPIQPLTVRALAKGPRTETTENQGPLIELDNKIMRMNFLCLPTATCMAKVIRRGEHQGGYKAFEHQFVFYNITAS
jgi:hypothetical protein